jgi:hypothetical protein
MQPFLHITCKSVKRVVRLKNLIKIITLVTCFPACGLWGVLIRLSVMGMIFAKKRDFE